MGFGTLDIRANVNILFDNPIQKGKYQPMPIYFAFSDECGDYTQYPNPSQLKSHPFYIRATLLMDAEEWKGLSLSLNTLKDRYGIAQHREIKWAYLHPLAEHQKKGKKITNDKDYFFLRNHDYRDILDFVDQSLSLISELDFKKIIITFTDNNYSNNFGDKYILAFHIQELMQRIEMELEHDGQNLAVLFFDPVSEKKNAMFREIYFDLYRNGDFIKRYCHIKDCLNIEFSHQSCGIQIADYIAGSFRSILMSNDKNTYQNGTDMFFRHVYPNLRRIWGNLWGYGIREVPQSSYIRRTFREKIASLKQEFDKMILVKKGMSS